MHYTLTVALPQDMYIYSFLEPYCEFTYEWNDNGEVIGPDGTVYKSPDEAPFTFFDWLSLGGRRDGYIKGKRGSFPAANFKVPEGHPGIDWRWRGSAFIKKYIKGFGFNDKELSKVPLTHSILTEEGDWYEWPEMWRVKDEKELEKQQKKYEAFVTKWYKSIPDDYVIYIIDYHI